MLPPVKKQRLSNNFIKFRKSFKSQMEDQLKDATSFYDFYIDLIHSFSEKNKYFLSEDIVLDYFGRTIKGQKNVTSYIKSDLVGVAHLFKDPTPVDKIGFRDTHIVTLPKEPRRMLVPFFSPPKCNEPKTPPKNVSQPSTSAPKIQRKQHGMSKRSDSWSPVKRLRLSPHKGKGDGDFEIFTETDVLESESDTVCVKYMMTEGYLEFRKPSLKKLQAETKWKRPCRLSIAYSSDSNQDCTIYLIIYEGNVKCRRNLLKEFEEAKLEELDKEKSKD